MPCGPVALRRAGDGFPLILVHGWRASSRYWADTLDGLADVRRCHAWDLPGHGESPPRRTPIDIASLAKLTLAVADRCGLDRFDIAGHSFGGAVALQLAAHWPDRVRRLAVIGLGTVRNGMEREALGRAHALMSHGLDFARPWIDFGRPLMSFVQPWIEGLGRHPTVARTIAAPFVQQMPSDIELVREGVLEMMRADPLSALEVAVASASPSFVAALSKVRAPTLLLSGMADRIMPASAVRALAEHLPHARLVLMPECGHLPMIEQPDEYLRVLRGFLTEDD